MSTSPSTFTGASSFSTDFQSVIDRSVAIRSLGLTSLGNEKNKITAQSSAVAGLDTVFSNLQNAVTAIQTATGVSSLSTSVSTAGVVQPTLSAGALPGPYNIEVTSLGAATSTLSKNGLIPVSDPTKQDIGAGTSFTLTINGVDHTITPTAANLNSLVSAINSTIGLNVQASIVNLGASGSPDYRLALQSTKLGAISLQLSTGIAPATLTPLLDTLNPPGAVATYRVNGLTTDIPSDSRTITLAPGLNVNLLQQSPTGVASTITVSQSSSAISSAFSGFAVAYNAAVAEIDKNRGTASGALAGDSLLYSLQQSLHSLTSYSSGANSLDSLTSLGFSFDKTGVLSFDATAFATATTGNLTALTNFIGDSKSGFIKSASDALSTLEDPTSGVIKTRITSLASQSTDEDALIAAEQTRVDQYKTDLTAQISAADALISSLQQQVSFVTGLFAAETADSKNN